MHEASTKDPQATASPESLEPLDLPYIGPMVRPELPNIGQMEVHSRIGPYKLLQKLGEGGMGTVWVAEQTEPVKRRVALKAIKPGMDSAQVMRRFEVERQALALMDHTNIAKVLDAGETPEGRPYFVMELVKGVPITKYCDELHLSLRERLALFVPVCHAIQHAHSKGIIHRDIKPSNVLVTMQDGKPVPKVIDFGVAKALHQHLTDQSVYTEIGAVVGTLQYMSPEQAELSPLDVDTRADVYALGVLLYELLTGTTPLDKKIIRQAHYLEVLRLIREEEPPRPSTRLTASKETLSNLATQRRTDPGNLKSEVRGELDWITMKCLEKDRTRRYETAAGLAKDIDRFLNDETVEACPPNASYRLAKLARKHRTAVWTAGIIGLLLILGTAVSTWQAFRAISAESAAKENETNARAERDEKEKARGEAVANEKKATLAALGEKQARDEATAAASQARKERDAAQAAQAEVREQLDRFRRVYYDAQLHEVSSLWHSDSARALELLEDPERCPIHLRDYTWGLFSRLSKQSPRRLSESHESGVRSLAFSADGRLLATADSDGIIKIWSRKTGKALHLLEGAPGPNQRLAFSPDGGELAAFDQKNYVVRRWNTATAAPLPAIENVGFVHAISYRDSKSLAYASGAKVVLWQDGGAKRTFQSKDKSLAITSLAFSADRSRMTTGHGKSVARNKPGLPGLISVWNLETGEAIRSWTAHRHLISSIAFSADAKQIISASHDGMVKIWNAGSGEEIDAVSRWRNVIDATAIGPTGRIVALSSYGFVQIVDSTSGDERKVVVPHGGTGAFLAVAPEEKSWASSLPDGKVGIWENLSAESATLKDHTGTVYGIDFSPDGKYLATCSGDSNKPFSKGEVKIWDVKAKRVLAQLDEQIAGYYGIKFSPDGKTIAACTALGEVKRWDADSRKLKDNLRGHIGWVRCVAFSPDGQLLASGGADSIIHLRDTADGKIRRTLTGHQGRVTCLAFSPESGLLISGTSEVKKKVGRGEVKLWDAKTGVLIADLPGHANQVFGVAFAPDGKTAVSVDFDQKAILWDISTRKALSVLGGNSRFGKAAAFTSDGRTLAIGSGEVSSQGKWLGTIKLWDPVIGQIRASFPAHDGFIAALAFNRDGTLLASSGTDGAVRFWAAER